MKYIDLRSDTLTVPTDAMRKFILEAPVGDDVFGEDPSVNELQDYTAELLGKEDALFVPSGTMANQICIAVQTNAGEEVIVESDAHIFYYETAAPSIISRVQLRTIPSAKGEMEINAIRGAIRSSEYYFPKTSMICLENTHNRHGGSVISLNYIKEVAKITTEKGLAFHCDGARLWNACAATGISPKDYAEPFDTISVCLSKGLGAPVGSLIAGSRKNIEKARKWRKILGGGMRQAGIIASAGMYALKNNYELLAETHETAKYFAHEVNNIKNLEAETDSVETNMVMLKHPSAIKPAEFEKACKNEGLLLIPIGNNAVRTVFHFQITRNDAIMAIDILDNVMQAFSNRCNC